MSAPYQYMAASWDARRADISELLPHLSSDEVEAAVKLWCKWHDYRKSPLDASTGDWATFVAQVNGRGNSSDSVRV